MARLIAFIVALAVGIGGVLPRWTAYRCAMMESIAEHACCDKAPAAEQTIASACCDAFDSPAPAVRSAPGSSEPNIAPAPFAGLLPQPSLAVLASASSEATRVVDAAPPPRPAVLQLSSVLRV